MAEAGATSISRNIGGKVVDSVEGAEGSDGAGRGEVLSESDNGRGAIAMRGILRQTA